MSSFTRKFLYVGNTVVGEKVNGSWTTMAYGLGLAERGGLFQHWGGRG